MRKPPRDYHYAGIYLLVNLQTNLRYVGKSLDIGRRISEHAQNKRKPGWSMDRSGRRVRQAIAIDWAIYHCGWENFDWCVLERVNTTHSALTRREGYWIRFFKTTHRNRGYNVARPPKS